MEVTRLEIKCDCGQIIMFYSPSGKYYQKQRRCPICGKIWEVKDVKIERKIDGYTRAKDKINELQRVKDKIVGFLRNEGWSDENIKNFLISGEEVIKKTVKSILSEKRY